MPPGSPVESKLETNPPAGSPDTEDRLTVGPSTAERLRQAGLRATAPRIWIYDTLRDAQGHHSVEALLRMLDERGHKVSRMSAYNVLSDLGAVGLVVQADCGPGRALFEVTDTWHHHFVCRICRGIADIPCVKGEKPCLMPPVPFDGVIDEAQVIFRGVCASCLSAGRQSSD